MADFYTNLISNQRNFKEQVVCSLMGKPHAFHSAFMQHVLIVMRIKQKTRQIYMYIQSHTGSRNDVCETRRSDRWADTSMSRRADRREKDVVPV